MKSQIKNYRVPKPKTIKWYAEWISRGGEYNTDMYDYNRSLVSPDSKIRIDD